MLTEDKLQTAASVSLRWRKRDLFLMQEPPAVRGVQAASGGPLLAPSGQGRDHHCGLSDADVETVVIFSTWPLE